MNPVRTLSLLFCLLFIATTIKAQTVSADSSNLSTYVGTYTFPSGSPVQKMSVTVDKGKLYGEADGYGKNELLKQEQANTYKSTSSYGSIITFLRNAATNAVTGFTMAVQGTELTAKKDER